MSREFHPVKVLATVISALALVLSSSSMATGIIRVESPSSTSDEERTTLQSDTSRENQVGHGQIPESDRTKVLGPDWKQSKDIAWNLSGDSSGLHVLVAKKREGYRWTELVKLGVPSLETDRWVGNACMTADRKTLAVVYAPRAFTNDAELFTHGALAALVNLSDGSVTHLEGGYSLSYFNPGCGEVDKVVLSQSSPTKRVTRVSTLSASTPSRVATVEIEEQVTSLIPTSTGLFGVIGNSIVKIDAKGRASTIVEAGGAALELVQTPDGALAYLQHDGETAHAMLLSNSEMRTSSKPVELASGKLNEIGLLADAAGQVFIAGKPKEVAKKLPTNVQIAKDVSVRSLVSSDGELFSENAYAVSAPSAAIGHSTAELPGIDFHSRSIETGRELNFSVPMTESQPKADGGNHLRPEGQQAVGTASKDTKGAHTALLKTSSRSIALTSDGISSGTCAIDRNDPEIQAYQPRPAEVEWAVDKGVRQTLHSDFPLPSLDGGGRVPAQVMLGVLAQESNFWQASKYAMPGVTGNPLIGNFYGVDIYSGSSDAWFQIDYDNADCGYGISQVTDGMRSGDMTYSKQLLIATNYQANIARGLQILIDKWNQTRDAGLTINDGDPKHAENWFYALWAYNTGFYEEGSSGAPWGVGWLNNPANPAYPANRPSFLNDTPADAAHPQDWPYPEKVLGFAAHSVEFLDSVDEGPIEDTFNYGPAFQPAWWNSTDGNNGETNRENVKPPISTFCNSSNECSFLTPTICTRGDFKCWYHQSATWKTNCSDDCAYEGMTYSLTDPKPSAANSYPPNCSTSGLPPGALIIDNLPNGTTPVRSGCSPVTSSGTFSFAFASDSGKVDLHQLGSGFNSHFYFTHTRNPGSPDAFSGDLNVSGKWTLGQSLNSWTRVLVHMPSHGAWTQQANYKIDNGSGSTVTRSVSQNVSANKWVSLGVLKINGVPKVTLDNHSGVFDNTVLRDALSGSDDIAWDAVAFVPLSQKPSEFIVAMGDSFSSGEGTSAHDGSDFFRESDTGGSPTVGGAESPFRNACHRSYNAWSYGIDSTAISGSSDARSLVQAKDPRLDFNMIACSGALTKNIRPGSGTNAAKQQYAELTQMDRGFLDANTTLVPLTVGGNDIGFSTILETCLTQTVFWLGLPGEDGYDDAPMVIDCDDLLAPGSSGTLEDMVSDRLDHLTADVKSLLQQIHAEAPNAQILLQGYPPIFENGSECVFIQHENQSWLNNVASRLNAKLTKAADLAGDYVTYQNPKYKFTGRNLCTTNSAINNLIIELTPGDKPIFEIPWPGKDYPVGISAQSIHPNSSGANIYSASANDALRAQHVSLSASIVGGAPTTYYGTFRFHSEGPAAMNVTDFSTCGKELRLGLRKNDASSSGVTGQQDTNSLSWKEPHAMQNFIWTTTTPSTADLPTGWYAMNARLTDTCSGGGSQSWNAELYW